MTKEDQGWAGAHPSKVTHFSRWNVRFYTLIAFKNKNSAQKVSIYNHSGKTAHRC